MFDRTREYRELTHRGTISLDTGDSLPEPDAYTATFMGRSVSEGRPCPSSRESGCYAREHRSAAEERPRRCMYPDSVRRMQSPPQARACQPIKIQCRTNKQNTYDAGYLFTMSFHNAQEESARVVKLSQ